MRKHSRPISQNNQARCSISMSFYFICLSYSKSAWADFAFTTQAGVAHFPTAESRKRVPLLIAQGAGA